MGAMSGFVRMLSSVLALGLMALGVIAVAEAIPQLAGGDTQMWVRYYVVTSQLQVLSWNHPYVLGAGAALAFVGLLFLAAGLRRRRPPVRLVAADDGQVTFEVPRRALRRTVEQAVSDVDGVTEARVSVGHRKLSVEASAAPEPPESLEDDIKARVWENLDTLEPRRRPRVRTRVKTGDGRAS